MADLNDLPGNIEDIVRRSLEKRRKRGESVSPTWGMDLSRPESQEEVTPEWGMDLSPVAEASRKAAAGEESPDWGLDVSPLAQAIGATKQGKDVPGWGMDLSATSPEEVSDTWGLDLSPGSEDRKRLKSASARAAAGEDVPGWGYEYEPEAPEEPVGSLMGERITMDEPVIRRTASIPQRVGQTEAGEPITMDKPVVTRTKGPVEFGKPKVFGVGSHYLPDAEQRAAEAANAPPSADASRAEKRRYLIETMGIPPGFQFENLPEGQPWADIIRQDPSILESKDEELAYGFKRDGNRITGPSGGYVEFGTPIIVRKEKGTENRHTMPPLVATTSSVQDVAGTSPATSSDGPDTSGIYYEAGFENLANVGRALRGEALLRVAPGIQAREEVKSWLNKKRAAEARVAELDRQERQKMLEAIIRRQDAMDLEAQRRAEREAAREQRAGEFKEAQAARAEESARQRAFQAQQAAERRDLMRELARQRGEGAMPTIGPGGEIVGGTARGRAQAMRERAIEPRAEFEPIDPKKPTFRTTTQADDFDDVAFGVDAIRGHSEDAKREYKLWREQVKSGDLAGAAVTAGKLNARMMNMHARMMEAEKVQKTVAGAEAMSKILAFQGENALNPKNIALSERLPSILDAAVESSEKTLDALAKSRNLKKKPGAKATTPAAGSIIKVRSKATGTVKSFPAEAAQKYLAQADKFEEVK